MKDYRVVLYDQRGSGFSQIKPGLEHYTFDALVRELEALRKEVIGRETITLIGHSFGGLVAMRYAADNPGRVDRMVLVSPAFARLNRQSAARPFRLLLKYGFPPRDPERANQFFMNMFPALFGASFYDPKNYAKLRPGYASFAVTMAVRDSLGNYDFGNDLRRITAKTLILYGAADLETTAEKFQLELHGLIPGSATVKFEHSGHWAFLEEPALFRETVLAFMKKP
jgi:proline iminopeptidase